MKQAYRTLDGGEVSLAGLKPEEKVFLADIFRHYEAGANYLNFKNLYTDPGSMAFASAKRLGLTVQGSPLYRVCDDLARRLGLHQGYLLKEAAIPYQTMGGETRKELTTGQVAALAGCSIQAVQKAIHSWRLRARKVGRLALVWDKDAEAFAQALRGRRQALARRG
ncbi:MAG: hypothetical protein PHF00_02180 [Elusimicrobia bacterium]|nr:hypothetical protein [Elusimicrobiota bacterium]